MFAYRQVYVIVLLVLLSAVQISVTGAKNGVHQWFGRQCCENTFDSACKKACRKAESQDELTDSCRPAEERSLLACLDIQKEIQKCCPPSVDAKCRAKCRTILLRDVSLPSQQRQFLETDCSPQVVQCVVNYTQARPTGDRSEYLPCCREVASDTCRSKCINAVKNISSEDAMIDEIQDHCGTANFAVPLWQCFLRVSGKRVHGDSTEVTGIDSARLMCCPKAVSRQCRELCTKTFSKQYVETANDFHDTCSYDAQELELNNCLEHVENECQPGCSNMSFCTNFNYRPTELFHSCNSRADDAALEAHRIWSQGTLSMPKLFNFDIKIKDIYACEPEMWKSVACLLYIKPCQQNFRTNRLCRSDCLRIMAKCLATSLSISPNVTSEYICNKLSPHDEKSPCLSISPYLYTSSAKQDAMEVTTPCNPNPCDRRTQICIVTGLYCDRATNASCRHHRCVPGCPMGEIVTQVIPSHILARIPRGDGFRVCQCGQHHLFQHCQDLECVTKQDCTLPYEMMQKHGSKFTLPKCSKCICFAGQKECQKDRCIIQIKQDPRTGQMIEQGLPCDCKPHYDPVCAKNGVTYANKCLAQCRNFKSVEYVRGMCSAVNHCLSNSCQKDERCIIKRQTCLSPHGSNCLQYKCVKASLRCNQGNDPVCDTTGVEFRTLCELLTSHRSVAYEGRCLHGCKKDNQQVCGLDGNTYSSECAAWAASVLVDYSGPCKSIGQHIGDDHPALPSCGNVTCSNPLPSGYQPLLPPGACCPICAGEIRLVPSSLLVQKSTQFFRHSHLNVHEVLEALRTHIRIAECGVFGYINIDNDVTVLIKPITLIPTQMQMEACMVETEKIASLFASESPSITAFLSLSVFISVDVRVSRLSLVTPAAVVSSAAGSPQVFNSCIFSTQLFFMCYHMMVHS